MVQPMHSSYTKCSIYYSKRVGDRATSGLWIPETFMKKRLACELGLLGWGWFSSVELEERVFLAEEITISKGEKTQDVAEEWWIIW